MRLLFAFLIGVFAGLRSDTPPAAVAWAVYLGWLKLARPLSLIGSLPAVIILSLLALTELIFDKLPNTPSHIIENRPQITRILKEICVICGWVSTDRAIRLRERVETPVAQCSTRRQFL